MPAAQRIPAEEAFVITVGVPHRDKDAYCRRALTVLNQYGFAAAQTSDEALIALGEQAQLVQQIKENDPS